MCESISQLKEQFQNDELSNKARYTALCDSHDKIFAISGHLETMRGHNEKGSKALTDLQYTMGQSIDLNKIQKDYQRQ